MNIGRAITLLNKEVDRLDNLSTKLSKKLSSTVSFSNAWLGDQRLVEKIHNIGEAKWRITESIERLERAQRFINNVE